jgi:hypothetical protein
MNLNIFVELDQKKVSQLSFIEKTVPFMFSETKNSPVIYGAVHMVSEETATKLQSAFAGKDDVVLKQNDKVYVFPGCSIPQFKIKQVLKDMGAKFVSDYKEATVFLGSEKAFKKMRQVDFSINVLGGTYWNTMYKCSQPVKGTTFLVKYQDAYDKADEFYCRDKYSAIPTNRFDFEVNNSCPSFHMLTLLGAEILHRKLSQKIPIISEKAFIAQTKPSCVIDREMFLSLYDMLQSSDEENYMPALQTIANCDIQKSRAYLYVLIKYNYSKFRDCRFKNIKLFNKMVDLKSISKLSVRDFVIALINDDPENISKDITRQLFENEAETYIKECKKPDLFDIILVPKQKFNAVASSLTFKYELDDKTSEK